MKVSEILQLAYRIEFVNLNILECDADETNEFISTNNCYYIEACLPDYIKLSNSFMTLKNKKLYVQVRI